MKSFTDLYRPTTLDDLVGQQRAKDILGPMLRQNRIPGAILLTGEKSAGKTTLSRVISRVALCAEPVEGKPCGQCGSCTAIARAGLDSVMDFIESNAANDRGIDAMRSLMSNCRNLPMVGRHKVYLFDEAHQLTDAAQQALLKVVEEPPEHVIFIFATTNPEKLLNTLRSRCSRIVLKSPTVDDCVALLERVSAGSGIEELGITKAYLRRIATACSGVYRESLKALDQVYAMVMDAKTGEDAIPPDLLKSFIAAAAVQDVSSVAENVVRFILNGLPGGALHSVDSIRAELEPMLQRILQVLKQANLKVKAPKLFDTSFAEILGVVAYSKIETFPKYKEELGTQLLSVYKMFVSLYERTATRAVSLDLTIDVVVLEAASSMAAFLQEHGIEAKKKKAPAAETPAPEPVKKKEAPPAAEDDPMAGYSPKGGK